METASPGRCQLTLPREGGCHVRAGRQCLPGQGASAGPPEQPGVSRDQGRQHPAPQTRRQGREQAGILLCRFVVEAKPSMGRMLRGLGRCCGVGMLLLRVFPTGVGAGCTLASKPLLHIPSSTGTADNSTPEKEAGLSPRAQNKSLRPTAFLKQKAKHDGKIEKKKNHKSWQGDSQSQTSF